jgi:hypothetical protein
MFADAAFRSLSRGTHRWIRDQESRAVRQVCHVAAPETESSIVHSLGDFPLRRC